ncbi:hypothetical protein FRC00_006257 [Tulasnella sp. 408]|nr:hypothetical protein FRC00_006257 [Tulasnella sp. 408]
MDSTVLKNIKISRIDLGGLDAVSKVNLGRDPLLPDTLGYDSRFYFSKDLLPNFSTSQSQSSMDVTLYHVRIPLSDPKTGGTLVWKLLRWPHLDNRAALLSKLIVSPKAAFSQGGCGLCHFLGNLELYRCDDASEDLLDKLERRILDFDEEKSREPSGQRKFNLWVNVDDISAIPIFRRAILKDHCNRWEKPPLRLSRPGGTGA